MRLRDEMPDLNVAKTWMNTHSVIKKELQGKPTLVHFWSISCSSCKSQLKRINILQKQFSEDLNVVGVHMPRSDEDKDIKKIRDVVNEYQMHYPVAVDNDDRLTKVFRNQTVPSYYIFDEHGVLRYNQASASTMGLFERRIHRIVRKSS